MNNIEKQTLDRLTNLLSALIEITGEAKTLEEAKRIASQALQEDQRQVPVF